MSEEHPAAPWRKQLTSRRARRPATAAVDITSPLVNSGRVAAAHRGGNLLQRASSRPTGSGQCQACGNKQAAAPLHQTGTRDGRLVPSLPLPCCSRARALLACPRAIALKLLGARLERWAAQAGGAATGQPARPTGAPGSCRRHAAPSRYGNKHSAGLRNHILQNKTQHAQRALWPSLGLPAAAVAIKTSKLWTDQWRGTLKGPWSGNPLLLLWESPRPVSALES